MTIGFVDPSVTAKDGLQFLRQFRGQNQTLPQIQEGLLKPLMT